MKRSLDEKARVMYLYQNDPVVRGSFFKLNKKYSKLRKKKKTEFKQIILDKLDNLQSDSPKEYWNMVNSLREKKTDKPEDCINSDAWFQHFSSLLTISEDMKSKVNKIEKKNSNC